MERDAVTSLFRRWAQEEEARDAELERKEQEQLVKRELQDTLRKLADNSDAMKTASALNHKIWMGRQEAADYLGISTRTLDRKRETGTLRGYLVEGTKAYRFKRSDLDALMEG